MVNHSIRRAEKVAPLSHASHWLHAHFLVLLLCSYFAATIAPQIGLSLRSVHVGSASLPSILLATLLFNAGMGVRLSELSKWRRSVWPLVIGTVGNLFLPIVLLGVLGYALQLWHNTDETQNVLVGLALVASMPIAGSSTAWSQNAAGDMALSLSLVLASTLVSPAATPALLHFAGMLTSGDYSEDLHELAQNDTSGFLFLYVLGPSIVGMIVGHYLGNAQTVLRPMLRIVNSVVLLMLCYCNAAVSLPKTLAAPDWDFLALVLIVTIFFCGCLFLAGLGLSHLFKLARNQKASLTFGLGMSNNGTGLVIAAATLADHPFVLMSMLFYNLIQHLVAGFIDRLSFPKARKSRISALR